MAVGAPGGTGDVRHLVIRRVSTPFGECTSSSIGAAELALHTSRCSMVPSEAIPGAQSTGTSTWTGTEARTRTRSCRSWSASARTPRAERSSPVNSPLASAGRRTQRGLDPRSPGAFPPLSPDRCRSEPQEGLGRVAHQLDIASRHRTRPLAHYVPAASPLATCTTGPSPDSSSPRPAISTFDSSSLRLI